MNDDALTRVSLEDGSGEVAFLVSTPAGASKGTLLLAHGAGAAMDSSFMNRFAGHATIAGVTVMRFEFRYMAERRDSGRKRPPPAAEKLVGEFRAALGAALRMTEGPFVIGGKSLGGRVAAMVAGLDLDPRVGAVVCLGYPFHAAGDVGVTRLAPLEALRIPALVVQGERDPFGDRKEIEALPALPKVRFVWSEDGSHDLAPRGGSPATWDGNLRDAAQAAAALIG
ncbi:alpha/beta family hydrolase [Segnochrobactrum spirostomi]|uniref:alpha/beta family hydrolase n=1 Tax=Segnochrobactrum spirostomi TaxID=2608987 RepID=UPI001FE90355|nr:alpha/beta family hydrolase [Segnochrobactrum spirostomi]